MMTSIERKLMYSYFLKASVVFLLDILNVLFKINEMFVLIWLWCYNEKNK